MKFIDLSHPIFNNMSTYPSDPEVSVIREKEIETDRTLLHSFTMGTHTGTHLDVPAHIIPNGKKLNDFPLSNFSGSAVKIDEHSCEDLEKNEKKFDGIIFETGWYRYFNTPEIYYGQDRPDIPKRLVEKAIKLGIKFFGCDLPSVDASGSIGKPIHNTLLGTDIIIYESLTNLDQLPKLKPFDFYGFPLPFEGLDGSPVRAVGVI